MNKNSHSRKIVPLIADKAEDVDKKVVNIEKYEKIVDQEMTLKTLTINKSMFDFLSAELHPDKITNFKQLLVRQNGFIYILRIILFHTILITNQQLPELQCLLILALELVYVCCNIQKYMACKHFKTKTVFFAKVSQSVCLIIFVTILAVFAFNKGQKMRPVWAQKLGMAIVLIAMTCEFVVMIIGLIEAIIETFQILRKKK
jgi:uncharacterized membrane protein (DUF485 family)